MLLHTTTLSILFSATINLAAPAPPSTSPSAQQLKRTTTGVTISNTTSTPNNIWPTILPVFFDLESLPDAFLILVEYGDDMVNSRDWRAYLTDAWSQLDGELAPYVTEWRVVDVRLDGVGGDDRIRWSSVPGEGEVRGDVVDDFLDKMRELFVDRRLREITCVMRVRGRDVGRLEVRSLRGPAGD